ncbi:MAG: hypothetical protein M3X11_16840, partial [Acidobacteriota bacterium]|nr:hypothetical protein [Acidobacteriota bacterium]
MLQVRVEISKTMNQFGFWLYRELIRMAEWDKTDQWLIPIGEKPLTFWCGEIVFDWTKGKSGSINPNFSAPHISA